jgi:hypothetical protein
VSTGHATLPSQVRRRFGRGNAGCALGGWGSSSFASRTHSGSPGRMWSVAMLALRRRCSPRREAEWHAHSPKEMRSESPAAPPFRPRQERVAFERAAPAPLAFHAKAVARVGGARGATSLAVVLASGGRCARAADRFAHETGQRGGRISDWHEDFSRRSVRAARRAWRALTWRRSARASRARGRSH